MKNASPYSFWDALYRVVALLCIVLHLAALQAHRIPPGRSYGFDRFYHGTLTCYAMDEPNRLVADKTSWQACIDTKRASLRRNMDAHGSLEIRLEKFLFYSSLALFPLSALIMLGTLTCYGWRRYRQQEASFSLGFLGLNLLVLLVSLGYLARLLATMSA